MNKELAKILMDSLHSCGYEPRSYSGRGMYGRKCLAVSDDCPTDVIVNVAVDMLENFDSGEAIEVLESLRGACQDSLGMSMVIYWPNLDWELFEDQEENETEI